MASRRRLLPAIDGLLAAILLGALLLRLGYPALVGLPERTPLHGFVVDEPEYYGAAAVLADGRGLTFYETFPWTRVPAYPLFVGALFVLAGRDPEPVFVVQALLSVLTLAGLAWLAARIAARAPALGLSAQAAARWAALLGALWLPFTLFANLLLSETLFLLLMVGAIGLLVRWADALSAGGVAESVHHGDTEARRLIAAGVLLGLAALTRSTALAFVPLVLLWVAWVARRGAVGQGSARGQGAVGQGSGPGQGAVGQGSAPGPWTRALGRPVAAVLLGVALVQAPQVVYNYATYHRVILGDTSSGYNLWLASVGVKNGARLVADLRAIPNPADRQPFAYSQAFAAIAAHPAEFVAKGVKESLDLWRINFSSEERQVAHNSEGRVPAVHLWSLLVGEDLLYVLIVLGALLGLAAAPPDPLKALLGLWTLLWLVMAFAFFAVTRFRFPVVALLLPWVPLGAAYLVRRLPRLLAAHAGGALRPPSRKSFALFVLGAVFALLVAPSIPWAETVQSAARWTTQAPLRAAVPLLQTDPAAALVRLAGADLGIPDTLFARDAARLAEIAAAPAADHAALAQLAARPEISLGAGSALAARFEPFLLSGAIAVQRGDTAGAHTAFGARPVHAAGAEAVDWAATFLPPPRVDRLEVGSDLDLGALRGFYAGEQAGPGAAATPFRWSGPRATLTFLATRPGREVVIRWSAGRPAGAPPARVVVQLLAGGLPLAGTTITLPAGDTWQETSLARLPIPVDRVDLTLDTVPFVPGGNDPRALGVRVAWVALR